MDANDELDPADRAWIAHRSSGGRLSALLGSVGLLLSPIAVGAVFAALGLHVGLSRWRQGLRSAWVSLGIGLSALALASSVFAALLWGAQLFGILMGRSAMQEAQKWRGAPLPALSLPVLLEDGPATVPLHPAAPVVRHALVFIDAEIDFSREAIASVLEAAAGHPDCRVTLVDLRVEASRIRERLGTFPGVAIVGRDAELPPPLDSVVAVPTLVVVGSDGRIEVALVGIRPREELERLLRGAPGPIGGGT
ncbi:MAG: hypothetical protein ACKO0W_13435 [Planctomycetota bacterium]